MSRPPRSTPSARACRSSRTPRRTASSRARLLVVQRQHAGRRAALVGRQRRARPLQRAVHRRDGRLEQLGDLGGRPVQHLAQDQHGPLAAAAAAAVRRRRRAGSSRARRSTAAGSPSARTQAVRNRLDPRRPRAAVQVRDVRRAAGPMSIGSARRSRPSACRSRRWWRSGTARTAAPTGPRTGRCCATRGPSSPAPRLPPRTPSRASGSSSPSARAVLLELRLDICSDSGGRTGHGQDLNRPRLVAADVAACG